MDKKARQRIRNQEEEMQFEITSCSLKPDGDRYITVIDYASLEEFPVTYIYSMISYEEDLEVKSFFIRHKYLIEDGLYDD